MASGIGVASKGRENHDQDTPTSNAILLSDVLGTTNASRKEEDNKAFSSCDGDIF